MSDIALNIDARLGKLPAGVDPKSALGRKLRALDGALLRAQLEVTLRRIERELFRHKHGIDKLSAAELKLKREAALAIHEAMADANARIAKLAEPKPKAKS